MKELLTEIFEGNDEAFLAISEKADTKKVDENIEDFIEEMKTELLSKVESSKKLSEKKKEKLKDLVEHNCKKLLEKKEEVDKKKVKEAFSSLIKVLTEKKEVKKEDTVKEGLVPTGYEDDDELMKALLEEEDKKVNEEEVDLETGDNEEMEDDKEFLGNSGDNQFYLCTIAGEDVTDLEVRNAEGDTLLKASEAEIDASDTNAFILAAIRDLGIEFLSTDVISKYGMIASEETEETDDELDQEIEDEIEPFESFYILSNGSLLEGEENEVITFETKEVAEEFMKEFEIKGLTIESDNQSIANMGKKVSIIQKAIGQKGGEMDQKKGFYRKGEGGKLQPFSLKNKNDLA